MREERRKMVMKSRKMGMKMKMQRRSMTMRTMMTIFCRSMYQYTDHIELVESISHIGHSQAMVSLLKIW